MKILTHPIASLAKSQKVSKNIRMALKRKAKGNYTEISHISKYKNYYIHCLNINVQKGIYIKGIYIFRDMLL